MSIDLLAWAERFISTPSVSRGGNGPIAEVAARLMREVGLTPRWQTTRLDGVEHHNLIADVGPADVPGLLMVTHLDTVPPGDAALWTSTGGNPFRPTRDGDALYGLGSADAKVDLVCKLAALAELDLASLRRRLRVVGTCAEEIGLRGARHLVETGETSGFHWALVGEPSELVAIRAHKGYAVFEAQLSLVPSEAATSAEQDLVRFEGASAHSSTPDLGENAIERALEWLAEEEIGGVRSISGGGAVNQVPDTCAVAAPGPWDPAPLLAFHRAWRELLSSVGERRDPDFDPDHTVGNLGRIECVEGSVTLSFDLRPVPGLDPEAAVEKLERVARVRCVRSNPPLGTPEDSALVTAIGDAQEGLRLERAVGTKATCTEAGLLAASGLEAVVFGPGLSVGNVHRPNEYTRITELYGAREIYQRVVQALCGDDACTS